jgi:hypothetical protein
MVVAVELDVEVDGERRIPFLNESPDLLPPASGCDGDAADAGESNSGVLSDSTFVSSSLCWGTI